MTPQTQAEQKARELLNTQHFLKPESATEFEELIQTLTTLIQKADALDNGLKAIELKRLQALKEQE